MSQGKRPGGLTALAVINFVFGANNLLSAIGLAFISTLLDAAAEHDEEVRQLAEKWKTIGESLLYTTVALTVAVAVLMIASGVGYLKQKQFLGRTLGNAFALVSIASSVVWAVGVEDPELGGGLSILAILGVIYPLLTLALLNTTFKEDFVN